MEVIRENKLFQVRSSSSVDNRVLLGGFLLGMERTPVTSLYQCWPENPWLTTFLGETATAGKLGVKPQFGDLTQQKWQHVGPASFLTVHIGQPLKLRAGWGSLWSDPEGRSEEARTATAYWSNGIYRLSLLDENRILAPTIEEHTLFPSTHMKHLQHLAAILGKKASLSKFFENPMQREHVAQPQNNSIVGDLKSKTKRWERTHVFGNFKNKLLITQEKNRGTLDIFRNKW